MELTHERKIKAIEAQLLECGKQVNALSIQTETDPQANEALYAVLVQQQALESDLFRLKEKPQ